MSWFKLDDKWHSHPKTIGLSLSSRGLWSVAGAWCMDNLTDGFVPAAAVQRFGGTKKLTAELVNAGLWHITDGGYQFHEWLVYQPSKEKVLAEREKTRERVTKHRASAAGNTVCNGVTNAATNSVGTLAPDPDPDPVPKILTNASSPPTNSEGEFPAADSAASSDFSSSAPSERSLPAQASAWLFELTTQQWETSGRWRAPLTAIARKPQAERDRVAETIRASTTLKPAMATPQHIADYWHLYSQGKEPGSFERSKPASKHAGPSEITADRSEYTAEKDGGW